ncbi:MAG: DUF928 domain-containing protein, partial [Cyanobacteriota bacterium]|nr:DUF928 domain-containing protein [Cyanobacteriota bacterium]
TLTLGLFINISKQVQAQSNSPSLSSVLENAFRPSTPPELVDVFIKGRCPCLRGRYAPTAIVPASRVGETIADQPTVFWYMPPVSAEDTLLPGVEFVLEDSSKQMVFSTQYSLPKLPKGIVASPSIMNLTFANSKPLEFGQEYHWSLSIRCDSRSPDRSQDDFTEGRFKRVKPDPTLEKRLLQATPSEHVAIYAQAGLWYETVDSLLQLRHWYPDDKDLAEAWKTLLTTVGLGDISSEPI